MCVDNKARQKILLYRPDNIGDVVLFTGSIRHIRDLYPDDEITLAVQPHVVNLVELCPHVDSVISVTELVRWKRLEKTKPFYFYLYRRGWKIVERIISRMFPAYDLILYPVKSPQPAHIELLDYVAVKNIVGIAGCKINASSEYPSRLDPYHLYAAYYDVANADPWKHELLTTVEFLQFLGCNVENSTEVQPTVWLAQEDKDFAVKEVGSLGSRVIGLFPGASNPIRAWNIENYAVLAEESPSDCTYVIFGGPSDVWIADLVATQLRKSRPDANIVVLAGKTTLRQLYACISHCSVLISMETGALHMGIAAGVPTVGIVGGGHYGRFIPWGDPRKNLFVTDLAECFNCNWQCQYLTPKCIADVDVKQVLACVNQLISWPELINA